MNGKIVSSGYQASLPPLVTVPLFQSLRPLSPSLSWHSSSLQLVIYGNLSVRLSPLFLGASWTSARSDAGRKKYLSCFLSSKLPLRPRLTVHVHFTRRPWTPSWSSSWSPSWMLWCTLWLQSVASISRRWPAGWGWHEERMSPLYDGVFKELYLN